MTNAYIRNQLRNDSVLASCNGNTMFYEAINKRSEKMRYCHACDCIDGHACLICEKDIEESDCFKFEGHCFICFHNKG